MGRDVLSDRARFGEGVVDPTRKAIVIIAHQDINNPPNVDLVQSTDDANGPTQRMLKSRSILGSPAAAHIGDRVADYQGFAYAGTLGYSNGTNIRFYVDDVAGGLVANQNPPQKMVFETCLLNAAPVAQTALWSTGKWSFGADLVAAGLAANLHTIHGGANNTLTIMSQRSSTDASGPSFRTYKTRGTIAAPIKVESGDSLGKYEFNAHDGVNADQSTAMIQAKVDAATVNGQRPASRIEFSTNLNNAAAIVQGTIDSAGRWGIGFVPVTTAAKLGLLQMQESSVSGIYLGNTANTAANVLDWYEEGTWTPNLTFSGNAVGMAYTVRTGRYTRIGNRVFCKARIQLSAQGSSVGTVEVSGPFNIANQLNEGGYITQMSSAFALTGYPVLRRGTVSTNTFRMAMSGSTTQLTDLTETNATDTWQFSYTLEYEV